MMRTQALLQYIRWGSRARRALAVCLTAFLSTALLAGCDGDSAGAPGGDGAKAAKAKEGKGTDEHGHAHGSEEPAEGEAGHDHAGHDHGGGEHADEVVLTPEAIRANGIRIAKATPRKLVSSVTATARVTFNAERMAHVGSVLTGRVSELKIRVGDEVKKGDVLVVIDSTELGEAQSEFIQRRTTLETAGPAVKIAKENYDAAKELFEKSQGIAAFELRRLQGELQTAQGTVASATASLTAAENRLQLLGLNEEAIAALSKSGKIDPKYVIRAPIDGRVVEREVTLGELVGPDKERLLTIADLRTIWVVADIPEAKLGQVSVGSPAEMTVPALGSQTFSGKVANVAAQLDAQTRTARVRVEVENPDAKLLPGMFASAEIKAGGENPDEEVLAISDEAVQTVEGEPAVFVPVEGEANTFAKRAVGIGDPIGGMVQVLAGLKPGERYVASGSFLLKAELGKAGAAHEH